MGGRGHAPPRMCVQLAAEKAAIRAHHSFHPPKALTAVAAGHGPAFHAGAAIRAHDPFYPPKALTAVAAGHGPAFHAGEWSTVVFLDDSLT